MNAVRFIHGLRFEDLPAEVVAQAKRCLLDLVGVAAAGRSTELSRIVHGHAVRHMGSGEGPSARLLFDGRRASPAGAAFAGAFTIDSFDAHDGHPLTKGHAGVAILPALLAFADSETPAEGRELIARLVLGYEVAIRAGIALHASVPDYHTSGAWNALACAALGARALGLDEARTRHALGIAEYHGPRSQMMRVIAHPTMLKDGSGQGAFAGVSAAYLALDGFTGAPAITVEADDQAPLWDDLGGRWRIMEQYFKPYPVCRWAQPAIEAAAGLVAKAAVPPDQIARVTIETFSHSVALGKAAPATTEEAQYAIGFPVAAYLVKGRVGAAEIDREGLRDPATLAMLERIDLKEEPAFSARFPVDRLSRVTLRLADGRILVSPDTIARGNPENPLSDREISAKFDLLAAALSGSVRRAIPEAVDALDRDPGAAARLRELVLGQPLD